MIILYDKISRIRLQNKIIFRFPAVNLSFIDIIRREIKKYISNRLVVATCWRAIIYSRVASIDQKWKKSRVRSNFHVVFLVFYNPYNIFYSFYILYIRTFPCEKYVKFTKWIELTRITSVRHETTILILYYSYNSGRS